jgi:hypothetical protein
MQMNASVLRKASIAAERGFGCSLFHSLGPFTLMTIAFMHMDRYATQLKARLRRTIFVALAGTAGSAYACLLSEDRLCSKPSWVSLHARLKD